MQKIRNWHSSVYYGCKKKEVLDSPSNTSNSGSRTFELIETAANIPGIKNQPISGKSIIAISSYNGVIYFGYGDGNLNTGPIKIVSYAIETDSFTVSYTAMTECIDKFYEIDGDLYIPNSDPKTGVGYKLQIFLLIVFVIQLF